MQLSELQQKVFLDRYALKDEHGNPTEIDVKQMWARVAQMVAQAEKDEDREKWRRVFEYELLRDFKFIPGGRILSAAPDKATTFFNCYVMPSPTDSRFGIMNTASKMVEIMSHGGGVGINLSTLRPKGAPVKGVNGQSSGAVRWGELYDAATACVNQGGSRRGALMLMLNVDHPDIIEFITAKKKPGVLTNANLSVGISDKFMQAVKQDLDWALIFNGGIYRVVKARLIYNLICECAWESGEPGVVFLDRMNQYNNTYYYEEIIGVNPCGEEPLPANGVCNLGSINLTKFVTWDLAIDWDGLAETVCNAVRFLDNVVDVTPYIYQEHAKVQQQSRRVGLGTMGLADMLIMLGLRYGSQESIDLIDALYEHICIHAYLASVDLAHEKGAFPAYSKAFLAGRFISRLPGEVYEEIAKHGIRNACLLTQAPTGSTGLLAGVSSGIEPVFAFEFTRRDRLGEHMIRHPLYEKWLAENIDSIAPGYFVTAHEVTPDEHIAVQAAIQRWVDASISKTVNAPASHAPADVRNLYLAAYDKGCKGITYYRDGSREGVLTKSGEQPKPEQAVEAIPPAKRPVMVDAPARRIKVKTGCGDIWLTCVFDEVGILREVFTVTGHNGGCASNTEALSRMISCALRFDIPVDEVVRQLGETKPCRSFDRLKQRDKTVKAKSCPDAIARELLKYEGTATEAESREAKATVKTFKNYKPPKKIPCPDCGQTDTFYRTEGCQTCMSCGFSKCG